MIPYLRRVFSKKKKKTQKIALFFCGTAHETWAHRDIGCWQFSQPNNSHYLALKYETKGGGKGGRKRILKPCSAAPQHTPNAIRTRPRSVHRCSRFSVRITFSRPVRQASVALRVCVPISMERSMRAWVRVRAFCVRAAACTVAYFCSRRIKWRIGERWNRNTNEAHRRRAVHASEWV